VLGGDLVVAGGLVLGVVYRAGRTEVAAVSAATGETAWTTPAPKSLVTLSLIPGRGIVLAEDGRSFGQAPAAVYPAVTQIVALDLRTGRQLWTTSVPGRYQDPPLAVSAGIVLAASLSGAITARQAMTGRLLWRRPPPSGCALVPGLPVAIAADQRQAAASFECAGYRALVQMLDLTTGALSWSWLSPRQPDGTEADFGVTGVASQGDVVLLTGQDAPPGGEDQLVRAVPRSYSWPASLGSADNTQVVLALDASTGKPRWMELGGQLVSFTLTDGAVCETVNLGLECRDDVTGVRTSPVVVTGQPPSASPPFAGDDWAGIAGSLAVVTVAPFRSGRVSVELIPVRGNRPLGTAEVSIGTSAEGANYQAFVVAAGALPGGRTLYLLRRVDRAGFPVIALEPAAS
jgi:outer membrane protein assembly factor BamB